MKSTYKPLGFIIAATGLIWWLTSSSVQINENTLILPINSNVNIQSNMPNGQ